jgi:general secretion pathway protein C
METFIRRHFWTLTGVILLLAVLGGALAALEPGIELEQAQVQTSLRVKLPDSQVAHEARWSLMPREAPAAAPPTPGIREVGEGHAYDISVADVEAALGGRDALVRQARVAPAFQDGMPRGLEIFSIQPGSLFERLGLQPGDVLRRINGVTLDSPESVLDAYTRVRDARRIRVELERQGLPIQKLYTLK